MKARITVTWDMVFDDLNGECQTEVRFVLPDRPLVKVPRSIQKLVLATIRDVSGAAVDAENAERN